MSGGLGAVLPGQGLTAGACRPSCRRQTCDQPCPNANCAHLGCAVHSAPAVVHVIDTVLLPIDLLGEAPAPAAAAPGPAPAGPAPAPTGAASSSALASVAALAASLLAAAMLV